MIRCSLIQTDLQELPQCQRIGQAPCDAPFRVNPLEVSDQQRTKVHARSHGWAAFLVGIDLGAFALGKPIKLLLVEQMIQALVERMAGSRGEFVVSEPETLLDRKSTR